MNNSVAEMKPAKQKYGSQIEIGSSSIKPNGGASKQKRQPKQSLNGKRRGLVQQPLPTTADVDPNASQITDQILNISAQPYNMVNRTVIMDMNDSCLVPEQNSMIDLNLSNLAMTDYNTATDGTQRPAPGHPENLNASK